MSYYQIVFYHLMKTRSEVQIKYIKMYYDFLDKNYPNHFFSIIDDLN